MIHEHLADLKNWIVKDKQDGLIHVYGIWISIKRK